MLNKIKNFVKNTYKKAIELLQKFPLVAFILLLLVLFVLLAASNFIQNQNNTEEPVVEENKKSITTYVIGEKPKLQMQAVVEKSNVVTITSFTSGVLNKVYVKEGDYVNVGDPLFYISSNYSGQNTFAVQTQIASTQLNNLKETYETQKDIIRLQKESAKNSQENNENLSKISQQSISETQDLIDLNKGILDTLDQQIQDLQDTNNNGSNDSAILSAKQLKSQFLASTNALQQGLRNTKYSSDLENTQNNLSKDQKEITLKQLEIQEKALELNLEVSRLNVQLARINQSLYSPTSPVSGVVQRVFKSENDTISNFEPVVVIAGPNEQSKVVLKLSKSIYQRASAINEAEVEINGETVYLTPNFISTEATDGGFYTMSFLLPKEYSSNVFDGQYISIQLPVGLNDSISSFTYVPIDLVHQTQDESYVYVVNNNVAESRKVTLGNVFGGFVEVKDGVSSGDSLIVRRDITTGDSVEVID